VVQRPERLLPGGGKAGHHPGHRFRQVRAHRHGLLAFQTVEEAAAALDEVNRDYPRHCRAAREIAEEHFAADRVLARLCREADL
jgi:hypothetical protein